MKKRDEWAEKLRVLGDQRAEEVLLGLHEEAARQDARLVGRLLGQLPRWIANEKLPWERLGPRLSDLFLAVDPDNGLLCYTLLRALRATRVVEVGTSMGVSTIYLALAVRHNGGGQVIATERVPEKIARAREHWSAAGVSELIDLRVGDAKETLAGETAPIDFVFNDAFPPLALPILQALAPAMRPGAVALCGNAVLFPADHAEYVTWVRSRESGFRSLRLPMKFAGEISVRE